jgi:uncharacterized SAM-binding protein YcdF (DUF218 family)
MIRRVEPMLVVGSQTEGSAGPAPRPKRPSSRRRAMRLIRRLGLIFVGLPLLALAVGFAWFIWRVPADEVVLDRNADGIVVLTGGASRIADAIELLASGRGQRLLISGVHRTTSQREIQRLIPKHEQIIACCVDLDRSAVNTVGNATGTRRWVKERGFHSLIVVTSNYHMPRAMAELGHQIPDVVLIPFPVVTEKQRIEAWWSSETAARLLISEYLKFLLAQFRMRLDGGGGEGAASAGSAAHARHISILPGPALS